MTNETAAPGAPLAELTSRALDPGALLTGDDPSARREARAEAARRGLLILPRAAVEAAIDAARDEGARQAGGAREDEVQRALDNLCANEGETLPGAAARVRRELDAWPTLMQGAWPLGVPAPGTAEWVSTLRHELGAQPVEDTVEAARRALREARAEGARQALHQVRNLVDHTALVDLTPEAVLGFVQRRERQRVADDARDAGLSPAGGALRRDLAAALDLEAPADAELVEAACRARAGEVALGRVRASVGALDGEDVLAALDRWCAELDAQDAAKRAQVPWRVFAARCWQLLSTALDRELRGDDDLRQEVLGRLRRLVGVAADAKQARREVGARDGESLEAALRRALREGDAAAHLRGYLDALRDSTGADRATLPRDLSQLEQLARRGRLRADAARRAAVLECLEAAGAPFGLPSKIDPDAGISRLREHVADLRSTAAVAAVALLERGAQLCREDESWAAAVGRAEVWRHQVERARRALRLGDGADVGLACERLARSSAWAEPVLTRALGFAGADDPVAAVSELRGILDAHPGDDLREAARRALRAAAANASLPAKSLEVALRREARVAGLVRAAALRDALRVVLSGRVSASRGPGHPLLGALVRARSRVSRRDPCRAVAVRQVKIAAEILGGVDGDPCAPTLIELARRAAGDLEDVRRVLSAGTSRHEARDELGALVPQTELGRRVRHLRLTLRGLHRSRGAVWRALSASAGDLPARLPARTCRAVEVALDRAARGAREAALSEAVALASGTALPASPLGDLRLLELALAGAQQRAREVGEQVAWTFGARAALLRAGVSGAEDLDPDGLARAAERLGREADDGRAAAALGLAGASWVPRYRLRGLGVLRDGVMARAAAAAAGVEVSEELHVRVPPLPRGAVLHDPATLPPEVEEELSRAVGYAAGSGDAAGVALALRSVLAALSPGGAP